MAIHARRAGWISLALSAAVVGVTADQALASYTADVRSSTLVINGNKDSDELALRLSAPTTLVVDVGADGTADFSFDRTLFTDIDVSAGGGDDRVVVDQSGGAFIDEQVWLDGGSGDDQLLGGAGADLLTGGSGNDFLDGNTGIDEEYGGPGTDTFQWDPGDNSDFIEGEAGRDTLAFNGANIGELIDVMPNGNRVRFTRNVASVVQDLGSLERINVRAVGGADVVTVGDLARTDLETVTTSLDASTGGGDGAADVVTATGTSGVDKVTASSPVPGEVLISGLAVDVIVDGAEPALDNVDVPLLAGADSFTSGVGLSGPVRADGGDGIDSARYDGGDGDDAIGLAPNGGAVATFVQGAPTHVDTRAVETLTVRGLDGADTLSALNGIGALTALTLDGGEGADTLRGGDGADTLLGGNGDDLLDGNLGADEARLGAGDDHFQWDPGDSSDSVDGQAGHDTLDFNASNAGEAIDIFRNGSRTKLTRNIGSVTMDFDGMEGVIVKALGGADTITVDDMKGTGVETTDVQLAVNVGGADGSADAVVVNGTSRNDVVDITRDGAQVHMTGLGTLLRISDSETADQLRVNLFGGDDDFTITQEVNELITPVIDLGQGG